MADVRSPQRPVGLIPGSARLGTPRSLAQVVSIRFTARLLKDIRLRAEAVGLTISEWIRNAATARIFAEDAPVAPAGYRVTGWSCPHVSMTAGGAVTLVPAAGCGCEMQPIYAAA